METSILEFNQQFYIPSIQKLALYFPHVPILGTHNCENSGLESFNHRVVYPDTLCCQYYAEYEVSSFAHQIQSEYYGRNISVFIDGIVLEQLSASDQETLSSSSYSCNRHALFHHFCQIKAKNMQLRQLHIVIGS